MNQAEYVKAVILGLTRGATFPIIIAGINCNALIDTSAAQSSICEHFHKQFMLLPVEQVFHLSVTSASGITVKPLGTVKCPF